MGTYIIRRVIGALLMLVVVSMITFSIFFVVPRLSGATPESFASRYVGRTANAEQVRVAAEKLGLTDPIYVQYGRWARRSWSVRTMTTARAWSAAQRPASATRSSGATRSGRTS